jgi:hypothetical protein
MSLHVYGCFATEKYFTKLMLRWWKHCNVKTKHCNVNLVVQTKLHKVAMSMYGCFATEK